MNKEKQKKIALCRLTDDHDSSVLRIDDIEYFGNKKDPTAIVMASRVCSKCGIVMSGGHIGVDPA